MENKVKNKVFAFFPEVPPTFSKAKGSANRMENKANNKVFAFFPEVPSFVPVPTLPQKRAGW